jgi:serine protease Do
MKRLLFLALPLLCSAALRAADIPALWAERVKCTAAVEYFTETESERHATVAYGTVIDSGGTIILPPAAIDVRVPPEQLKDFKVYLPGDPAGFAGTYLGQDAYTGWHFVRAEEKARARMVPVTAFADPGRTAEPALAEELWGIGLRPKEEDFLPYLLTSHLALIQSLPQRTGITQQEVAGPGLPVFDRGGAFVGLALSSFGQTYMLFSQMARGGTPVILVDLEESSAFHLASEVLPNLGRIPKNVSGRPLAWLGEDGLEPMDRDVASFLKLGNQSGAVVSEVLEGSPAEKAGMKDRDIIIAIDGRPLPNFRPERAVTDYVDREISRRHPGDVIGITVLRGADRVELKATLGEAPTLIREAPRKYFERLGFTAREFVYGDAVERRLKVGDSTGVIVHYVKPNTPAALAGLQAGNWIKEIDGVAPRTFAEAAQKLSAIEADPARSEFVLLVSRGGETAVLRVKLK